MRHRFKSTKTGELSDPQIKLWILRLLVPLGGYKELIGKHGFDDDSMVENIGMGHWFDPDGRDYEPEVAKNELRKIHAQAEQLSGGGQVSKCLSNNLKRMAKLVGLSDTDCKILEFVILIKNEGILEDAGDTLGELSTVKLFRVLSVVLNIPESEVRQSLRMNSILSQSGLVTVDRNGKYNLDKKLDLLSTNFADLVVSTDDEPVTLLREVIKACPPAMLSLDDYKHIGTSLNILKPYLNKSINTRRKGVNIFIHGAPGTGKTELVKVIGEMMSCDLYEISSEDDDGEPIDGEKRLVAFRAAQSFLSKRKALILFDEVEDVFDGGGFWGKKSAAQSHKAWLNNILEENPVPAIWLSNSADGIDPAFIRRFDMAFELPVPSKKERMRILHQNCKNLIDMKTIESIGESEKLAPAVIARTSSVIRSISDELGDKGVNGAFVHLINNTLEMQGHSIIRTNDSSRLPEVYDAKFVHADCDVKQLAEGLSQSRAGRLCLYGPPGTGKTAYGRWLADQLGIPLHVKRASDLMSMWVGENEKNVARAFKEAEADGALLLIDEVDSFLQDRRDAGKSWEVTLVNEMLTQMENYSGVFIASTNLMEGLDQAALRRFDLKVKFGYLRAEQAWELFKLQCTALSIPTPEKKQKQQLNELNNLTPGDFAAVARRHQFQPVTTAGDLISALSMECYLKDSAPKRAIGFQW